MYHFVFVIFDRFKIDLEYYVKENLFFGSSIGHWLQFIYKNSGGSS